MKEKTNVLFVATDTSAVVGLGPSFLGLVSQLRDSYINPFVLCRWPGQNELTIITELRHLGIPVFTRHIDLWFPSPRRHGIRHGRRFLRELRGRVWSIASLIEAHDIHVVYTNALTCIDAALAARMTKRPHLWHMRECIQNNPDLRSYLPSPLAKLLIRRLSRAIIVNSGYLAQFFQRVPGDDRVVVVHNGVDLDRFAPRSIASGMGKLRRELGIADDIPLIGMIGTVNPRKGHQTLLNAARLLIGQGTSIHVVVIGVQLPDCFPALQQLTRQLNIQDRVHFLGARSDVSDLIHEIDILVLTSSQETFGRVLIEAMAAAKPVVSTRAGGPEEIVKDGETGWLVPVGDEAAVAEKLALLISRPEDRVRMGKAGRCRAAECFSHIAHARKIERIILGVAKEA